MTAIGGLSCPNCTRLTKELEEAKRATLCPYCYEALRVDSTGVVPNTHDCPSWKTYEEQMRERADLRAKLELAETTITLLSGSVEIAQQATLDEQAKLEAAEKEIVDLKEHAAGSGCKFYEAAEKYKSQLLALTEQNEKMRRLFKHIVDNCVEQDSPWIINAADEILEMPTLPSLDLYRAKEKALGALLVWNQGGLSDDLVQAALDLEEAIRLAKAEGKA